MHLPTNQTLSIWLYALFVFRMLTNNDIVDFVNAEATFFARDRFPSLSMWAGIKFSSAEYTIVPVMEN